MRRTIGMEFWLRMLLGEAGALLLFLVVETASVIMGLVVLALTSRLSHHHHQCTR